MDSKTKSYNFKEIEIKEDNYNFIIAIPKEGISNKDIIVTHYNNSHYECDDYEYSKNYLTYHENKVIKIFKSVKHSDSIDPKWTNCLNTDDNLYMLNGEVDDLYKNGSITIEYCVRSNIKDKILELIKKYGIDSKFIDYFSD